MAGPTRDFWQARFDAQQTPWDRGGPSPQLLAWQARGEAPAAGSRVVVPGCGSGWELATLAAQGCEVIGLDYAEAAVQRSRALLQGRGLAARVEQADVLEWAPAQPLDAVYEQTCLCALHPDAWVAYAQQLHRWLRPDGRLYALFMQALRPNAATGAIEGPPYHCDIHAMRALFPEPQWLWPKPPYEQQPHPMGHTELALVLLRR
ncbi:methyltransferase domain-containing protein [Eleftheria terrae]|uniref:methyltransferase domain-containing protein n=1 Tax=Eleftheria terrae TaxID=1597781 RepID=UPI00263B3EC4|nr:methyltransferase domain-containing protein [Eleftheria terrae]WKB54880.1 TPMT family class I SAM-dependent methyltransferase [Eleftheria terrae]